MIVTDEYATPTIPITNLPIIFWRNVVTTTNVTTDSEDPDFPVTNVANPSLGLKWKQDFTDSPTAMPDYIRVDTSEAGPINYVAVAGHNLGTQHATIAVEGVYISGAASPHDSPTESEFVTGYRPTDDGPIIFVFEETEGADIRLRLEQSPSNTTPMELAVLYVGKCTVLPEGIQADHTPLPLGRVNDNVLGMSENGSFLGRIVTGSWVASNATISNLSKTWVREELLDFLEFAAEFPFFWAWSPLTYPSETAFAFLANDPSPSFDIDGYAEIDLDMKGLSE
jgi:hypothetical protein